VILDPTKPDIFIEEWLKPAIVEVLIENPVCQGTSKAGVVSSLAQVNERKGYRIVCAAGGERPPTPDFSGKLTVK
jgi:hypothetical protein